MNEWLRISMIVFMCEIFSNQPIDIIPDNFWPSEHLLNRIQNISCFSVYCVPLKESLLAIYFICDVILSLFWQKARQLNWWWTCLPPPKTKLWVHRIPPKTRRPNSSNKQVCRLPKAWTARQSKRVRDHFHVVIRRYKWVGNGVGDQCVINVSCPSATTKWILNSWKWLALSTSLYRQFGGFRSTEPKMSKGEARKKNERNNFIASIFFTLEIVGSKFKKSKEKKSSLGRRPKGCLVCFSEWI